MISKKLTLSLASAASAFAMLSIFSACSSDETQLAPTSDSGAGGKTGTGGRRASGGSTTTGGATGTGGTAAACTRAVGTSCDGSEDCPTGQRCCGKFQGGYLEFSCHDSCTALLGDAAPTTGGVLWFDLCHDGDTCEDPTAQCTKATMNYLPGSLSRCYTQGGGPPDATLGKGKNEVNCGTAVCGASEQCCIRQPLEPYCAPKGATCTCAGAGDGGTTDGSTDGAAPDAKPPTTDGAPTRDASDAATKG